MTIITEHRAIDSFPDPFQTSLSRLLQLAWKLQTDLEEFTEEEELVLYKYLNIIQETSQIKLNVKPRRVAIGEIE